jgi:hypothetical protein
VTTATEIRRGIVSAANRVARGRQNAAQIGRKLGSAERRILP